MPRGVNCVVGRMYAKWLFAFYDNILFKNVFYINIRKYERIGNKEYWKLVYCEN